MTIAFLRVEEIEKIHTSQINLFGGSHGLRERELLESAAAMPKASFGGESLYADIYEMAAAYLFNIVKNHPFVDGNKRTGAVSALVFLATNGILVKSGQMEFKKLVLNIADNKVGKDEAVNFLRESEKSFFTKLAGNHNETGVSPAIGMDGPAGPSDII